MSTLQHRRVKMDTEPEAAAQRVVNDGQRTLNSQVLVITRRCTGVPHPSRIRVVLL
jgi:hypothetical protein